MPPFMIAATIILFFIPSEYRGYYPLLVIVVFWMTSHIWNYHAEKKYNKKFKNES